MKKTLLFILLFFVIPAITLSQGSGNYVGRLEASWNPGTYVVTKPMEVGPKKGSEFLNSEWYIGNIHLIKGSITGYPIKYDLLHSRLEINTAEGIKLVYYKDIDRFDLFDLNMNKKRYFVSGESFKLNGMDFSGLLEVGLEGTPGIYYHIELKIKEGTYIPTHAAGQMEDEIIQDITRYFSIENELHPADSKREIMNFFGDAKNRMKTYLKSNKLSLKNEEDIVKALQYYWNTLNK